MHVGFNTVVISVGWTLKTSGRQGSSITGLGPSRPEAAS
jgi:hypothetical protein